MVRGNPLISRFSSLIRTNSHVSFSIGVTPFKSRHFSSKPDLFTLDLDLDSATDGLQNDKVKNEKIKATEREKEDVKKNTVSNFQRNLNNVEILNDSRKTDAIEEKDKDSLDSILADIVFESEKYPKRTIQDTKSLFSSVLSNKNGTTSRDDLILDSDTTKHIDGKFSDKSQRSNPERHVIADEKELFAKIFASYSREELSDASEKLHKSVLSNLQDSFLNANKASDVTVASKSIVTLSEKESHTIEKHTKESLEKTLEHVTNLPTKKSVITFIRSIFHRFQETEFGKKQFYLHKLKGESSKEYLKRHNILCEQIKQQCESCSPQHPEINVFTLPVLFNHVISVITSKYYDGELALTLFNSAKEDLNLYTNVCNQKTYNEMLKVYWVFYGKQSLCEIELIVVEMMNNGFSGDPHTFAILKNILSTYYKMKRGQSGLNSGGTPIWSKEDDKRARNLTFKLKSLGRALQREKLKERGPRVSLGYRGHAGKREFSGNQEFQNTRNELENREDFWGESINVFGIPGQL